jgi:lipid II:glycine glycyltransferase (peptidoglycan interpeptide bridge formation enzyme)
LTVEVLQPGDASRWRRFVASSPQGDVLQAMEWGEVKSRTGWQPITLALTEGAEIVAGAMLLKRPAPLGRCLLYCPRGPVVRLEDVEPWSRLAQALRDLAREQRAMLVKIDPPVAGEAARAALRRVGLRPAPVEEMGFGGTQPRAVMRTSLVFGEEELLARFKPKWRYNIRLAERKGVTVTGDTTREHLKAFYDLLVETAHRDGFHVRGLDYYQTIWECLVERGLARLFLAYYQAKPIAGAIDFILGHQCWYVYGASSNDMRELMPNHLLQWTMMRWARAQGCTVYDFRGVALQRPGAESPLDGLARFKAGFAAEYVEYVGEWDLPVSPALYGAFALLEPRLRRVRLKLRRG